MKIWLTLLVGLLLLTEIEAKRGGGRKSGRKGGKGGKRGGKGGRRGGKTRPPKRPRPTPPPVATGVAAGAAAAGAAAAGAAASTGRTGPLRWEGPTPPAGTYPKSCHDIFESHAKECNKPEGGFYAIQVTTLFLD